MIALIVLLAIIGAITLLYILMLFVVNPMILAFQYTNAVRKDAVDCKVPFLKIYTKLLKVFFSNWIDFSYGHGKFITGGEVGRHKWGSRV